MVHSSVLLVNRKETDMIRFLVGVILASFAVYLVIGILFLLAGYLGVVIIIVAIMALGAYLAYLDDKNWPAYYEAHKRAKEGQDDV